MHEWIKWKTLLSEAGAHERAGRIDTACLEASHIVGQRSTLLHVRAHWRMLQLAVRLSERREAISQAARLFAAVVATWLWVPVGIVPEPANGQVFSARRTRSHPARRKND